MCPTCFTLATHVRELSNRRKSSQSDTKTAQRNAHEGRRYRDGILRVADQLARRYAPDSVEHVLISTRKSIDERRNQCRQTHRTA